MLAFGYSFGSRDQESFRLRLQDQAEVVGLVFDVKDDARCHRGDDSIPVHAADRLAEPTANALERLDLQLQKDHPIMARIHRMFSATSVVTRSQYTHLSVIGFFDSTTNSVSTGSF